MVLVAISLPYCMNLGKSSIWDANEAFYAETPREMLVSGDYLAPQFNFEPRAQKPPLTYWIILLSYKLLGVSEFAVRLPSALAAIGTLLFSYALARLLFGPRAALLSSVITGLTARIFILARRLPIDILLVFFLTGTLFFLVRGVRDNDRLSWAIAYVFAGLGFLTKGPVALVIPASAYLVWALWKDRRISGIHPVMGAAIVLGIVLPWYIRIYATHGWTYISPFFIRDNIGRFAAETLGPSRGPFYYFAVFATDFFPWSFLGPAAAWLLWLHRKEELPIKSLSFGLPVLWCAVTFVLFSLSKNRQEYYIAPMYPVAAVVLSGVIDKSAAKRNGVETRDWIAGQGSWFWTYGFLAIFLLLFFPIVPYILRSFMPGLSPVLHYGPSLLIGGGVVFLGWMMFRKEHVQCFQALAIPLWMIYVMCAGLYLPALESFRPVKGFCKIIEEQSDRNDEAGFYGTALPSMAYYLHRPIFQENSPEQMLHRFQSDKRVFCVLSLKDYTYFAGEKDVNIHILDRRSRFAIKLGTLLNAGSFPGEELLLVSNRPFLKSGRSGPTL